MNKEQFNIITQLISGINIQYKSFIDKLDKEFDSAKKMIILKSDDPKVDGLAVTDKVEEKRQLLESALDKIIEKYQDELNLL